MDFRRTRAWVVVGALWPVALLNYVDRLMLTTMREPVVAAIPMTDAQFGLLTSVFLWVYGALSPFGGFLADRYGRRAVILGSLAVWSVVTWATGQMDSLGGLLVARGLMGISEACYLPAALALIADQHPGRTRSLATGLHFSGIYAGAVLGGLGGVIAERFGWRSAFTLFGIVGLAYAPLLALGLHDGRRPTRWPKESSRRMGQVLPVIGPYSARFCVTWPRNRVFGFWRCSMRWSVSAIGSSMAGSRRTCGTDSRSGWARPASRQRATSRSRRSSAAWPAVPGPTRGPARNRVPGHSSRALAISSRHPACS